MMKLVSLTYAKVAQVLAAFKPHALAEQKHIDNQGVYLVVESLDDFRGYVANARVGVFVVYKTLKGRNATAADALLDDVIAALLQHGDMDIKRVSLVSADANLVYRIEVNTDIAAEVAA